MDTSVRKNKPATRRRPACVGGVQMLARKMIEAERCRALSVLPTPSDQVALILPAMVSFERLRMGEASINDLQSIVALLNTGSMLAHCAGEDGALAVTQAALHKAVEVKGRGGERHAMNAEQRSAIAVGLCAADDLFCCSTLLEITRAHRKLLDALPLTGTLDACYIEL